MLFFASIVVLSAITLTILRAKNAEAGWYNSSWLYRKQLYFNNAASSTNLSNFPVLVTLSSSNFNFTEAKTNGEDIRFTDSDGTTLLSYEIESYSASSQTAKIWVKIPQIDAASTVDSFFLYWGNTSATDAQDIDNTWNSNYKGVYHLGDNAASTTVTDSSGNTNTITASENTNNGFSQSTGKIGNSFLTAGTPTYITNQIGTPLSELYADIVLDTSGYPVIAYTDWTNFDLILVHCNDKECKGGNETVNTVDSANATGYYPSLQLDSNGYPMIAYQYSTGADLKYVHCNDVNCAGGNETFSTIETSGSTGWYPRMVLDASGYPVISYYYSTGADLKLVHCGNADCSSGNQINNVDTTNTVGNGYLGNDIILDGSGYPVISYYDTTNTELKVAHCNDANCAGSDESLTSPLSGLAKSLGAYNSIELDGSGFPMIAYLNTTDTNIEYIHCDDVNCAGDESASLKILETVNSNYALMRKNSSGYPVVVSSSAGLYPRVYTCSDANCTSSASTYLSLYNQYLGIPTGLILDSNNNIFVTSYSRGKTNQYDTILYTTIPKIQRAYDSDFDFGTSSFSVSGWVKSSGMVQMNNLLSRYDADQGFRLYQNYAGQTCFGVDDDATWGPDDSACSSNSQVVTNVDNGNAAAISWQSATLDGSGYPIIAYYDSSGLDLEIIHCTDANCTGTKNYASIDSTGNVGSTPSIALDGSGYPVIAYYDTTNTSLKTVHCGNANCSSGNTINTVDGSGVDDVGLYPTLKLDGSGYPVIAYYDTTNTSVKIVHCNDVNCAGSDETINTLSNIGSDMLRHGSDSLQLDSNGYPMVVYWDNTNGDLEYIHCNDVNCSGANETLSTIDSTGTVGDFASIALDGSGYPVIAYYDSTNFKLKLAHCGNSDCSSGNSTNTVQMPNSGDGGYLSIKLKVNGSGYPVILSTQLASWSIYLTVCNDANCAGDNETNSVIRDTNYSYQYYSLALDSNSYPVIIYSGGQSDLKLIHLSNTTTYTESGNQDDQNWHHVVGVKNGTSSITLYIDGTAVATDSSLAATGTLTSNSASLNLAEEITNSLSLNNWTGYLDEVQLDTTARSSDWIRAQYLSESNNFLTSSPTQYGPTANQLGNFTNNSGALKNNLIAYYKFDEGYGTTAHNATNSGSVYDGTISGATWNNNGKYGKALNFDGTDDYTQVSDNNALDLTTAWSIGGWFNPSETVLTGSDRQILISKWQTGSGTLINYSLEISTAGKAFARVANGSTNSSVTGTTTLSPGTWYQILATFEGSTGNLKIYVNGKLENTTATGFSAAYGNTGNIRIGQYDFAWSLYRDEYKGLIDEVKIYNATLTADEVKQDYNQRSAMSLGSLSNTSALTGGSVASNSASAAYCVPGSSDPCSPPVGEWNFEEGSGTTANDVSGNSNTGTITTASYNNGKYGKGLKFTNSGDKVVITHNSNIDFSSNSFTVSAWVKDTVSQWTDYAGIVAKETNWGAYTGWWLGVHNNGTLAFQIDDATNQNSTTISSANLNDGNWHFITAVVDRTTNTITLYKDLTKSTPTSITAVDIDAGDNLEFGEFTGSSTRRTTGSIDQVRIYNYARTPAQIAWDYNQGKPIAHWKMDECTGTAINDSSGNGNTGTITIGASGTNTSAGTCLTSGAWFDGATGKFNSSMDFDGTDDYIDTALNPFSNSQIATGSLSTWIKTTQSPGSDRLIVNDENWIALTLNSTGKAKGCSDGQCTYATSTTTVNDGQWHHLMVTWSGTSFTNLYVDGKLENTVTPLNAPTPDNHSRPFRFGTHAANLVSGYYSGLIDDVRIYNYALTAPQIKNVYNDGSSARFGP